MQWRADLRFFPRRPLRRAMTSKHLSRLYFKYPYRYSSSLDPRAARVMSTPAASMHLANMDRAANWISVSIDTCVRRALLISSSARMSVGVISSRLVPNSAASSLAFFWHAVHTLCCDTFALILAQVTQIDTFRRISNHDCKLRERGVIWLQRRRVDVVEVAS